jgi:hypothetical protein
MVTELETSRDRTFATFELGEVRDGVARPPDDPRELSGHLLYGFAAAAGVNISGELDPQKLELLATRLEVDTGLRNAQDPSILGNYQSLLERAQDSEIHVPLNRMIMKASEPSPEGATGLMIGSGSGRNLARIADLLVDRDKFDVREGRHRRFELGLGQIVMLTSSWVKIEDPVRSHTSSKDLSETAYAERYIVPALEGVGYTVDHRSAEVRTGPLAMSRLLFVRSPGLLDATLTVVGDGPQALRRALSVRQVAREMRSDYDSANDPQLSVLAGNRTLISRRNREDYSSQSPYPLPAEIARTAVLLAEAALQNR